MAKAKSTPIAEKIQKGADALRSKAKFAREHKAHIADDFVTNFTAGGLAFTDGTMTALEMYQNILTVYLSATKATHLIFNEVESNPKMRAQVVTLVSNIVDDVTSRINEFTNIIDSVAKSPDIQKAFEDVQEAGENFKNLMRNAASLKSKFGKKRKFHVVDDDDEGGDTTSTDRKRASGRKKSKH